MTRSPGNLLPSSYEEKVLDFRKQFNQRIQQFERAVQFEILTTNNAIRKELHSNTGKLCTDASNVARGRL